MEAESIFPVFGPLHTDDSPALVIPSTEPARKVFENTAKLFVVSVEQAEPSDDDREQEAEPNPAKVTGDLPVDTIRALYSLAYLSAFFSALEPSDLRQLADELGVRR